MIARRRPFRHRGPAELGDSEAVPDEKGRFRISVPRGAGRAWIRVEGRYLYLAEAVLVDLHNLPGEVLLEPLLGGVLRGRLLLPGRTANAPRTRPRFSASVHLPVSAHENQQLSITFAADDGFEFEALPDSDDFRVRVWSPEHCEAARRGISVSGGRVNEVLIDLRAGLSLSGHAVDDAGTPLDRFAVRLMPVQQDHEAGVRARVVERTFREADGRFVLRGLTSGEWIVESSAPGHAASKPVRCWMPNTSNELRLRLPRHGSFSGRVTTPAGEAASGARIEVVRTEDALECGTGEEWTLVALADAKGAFACTSMPPGRLRVTARAEGSARSEPIELTLRPAQAEEGLILRLRRPSRVIGRVDSGQGVVADRVVELWCEARVESRTVVSDAEGRFVFDDLDPGEYELVLAIPWFSSGAEQDRPGVAERMAHDAGGIRESAKLEPGESVHVVLGSPSADPVLVPGHDRW